jgi:hypothetical protein
MTQSTISRSMTKLGRATRAGAFTAMLALTGPTAAMASAWDQQQTEAGQDNEFNHQTVGRGYALAPQHGPYASAHRGRAIATPPAPRKHFQD